MSTLTTGQTLSSPHVRLCPHHTSDSSLTARQTLPSPLYPKSLISKPNMFLFSCMSQSVFSPSPFGTKLSLLPTFTYKILSYIITAFRSSCYLIYLLRIWVTISFLWFTIISIDQTVFCPQTCRLCVYDAVSASRVKEKSAEADWS
jgi:hypothetical protein